MKSPFRHRQSQRTGAMAEKLCEIELRRAGYKLIEHPEVKKIKTATGWVCSKKVSGDFRAVGPEGKSVLVECKWRDKPNLCPSDFRDHQIRSLIDHDAAGGISIVAHVSPRGCRLIPWPQAFKELQLPF